MQGKPEQTLESIGKTGAGPGEHSARTWECSMQHISTPQNPAITLTKVTTGSGGDGALLWDPQVWEEAVVPWESCLHAPHASSRQQVKRVKAGP